MQTRRKDKEICIYIKNNKWKNTTKSIREKI